jgi:hypothetical protein
MARWNPKAVAQLLISSLPGGKIGSDQEIWFLVSTYSPIGGVLLYHFNQFGQHVTFPQSQKIGKIEKKLFPGSEKNGCDA